MNARRVEAEGGVRHVGELGRYRLIAELAHGGMGVVFLALARGPAGFNKLLVVKELKPHLAEDPELVAMFQEEARLAARLSHPNVVQTTEVGADGGRHFLAMEYLEGQPLHRILARCNKARAPLPVHLHLSILCAALEGLHHAHSLTDFDGKPLDVVHRDATPQNLFVTYEGQVKVLDFGIAKAVDSMNETRAGVLKGKVAYMAPEQAAGLSVDRRVDVFAVGVLLWEAAVGHRMWGDRNDIQILRALMSGDVPKPRDVEKSIPERLERIILKATAVDRDARYATALELEDAIDEYLRDSGAPAALPRALGKLVAELFAIERARLRSIIDHQLRALGGLPSGEYRKVELAELGVATSSGGTPSNISRVQATCEEIAAVPSVSGESRRLAVDPRRAGRARALAVVVLTGVGVAAAIVFGMAAPRDVRPRSSAAWSTGARAGGELEIESAPVPSVVESEAAPLRSIMESEPAKDSAASSIDHARIEAMISVKPMAIVHTARPARPVAAPPPVKNVASESPPIASAPPAPAAGPTANMPSGRPVRPIDTVNPYVQ